MSISTGLQITAFVSPLGALAQSLLAVAPRSLAEPPPKQCDSLCSNRLGIELPIELNARDLIGDTGTRCKVDASFLDFLWLGEGQGILSTKGGLVCPPVWGTVGRNAQDPCNMFWEIFESTRKRI